MPTNTGYYRLDILARSTFYSQKIRAFINFFAVYFHVVQFIALFYPRERNSSRSKAVKQAVRSSGEGRRELGGPPGAGSNCPPGSRDRSNISCSSVWPATTWGVT